ncbi:hypothetical protein [Nocardia noduli]|uniref:hypothetical protein n=1 Tax=Nocardia noduli TaxID=2815722 RepID=UPI001C21E10A|nr:hypothetical protein [Nocardia noduli]
MVGSAARPPRKRTRRSPHPTVEDAPTRSWIDAPWATTTMVVALTGLSFWCLDSLLGAGVEINAALAAVVAILLCVGRVCGLRMNEAVGSVAARQRR